MPCSSMAFHLMVPLWTYINCISNPIKPRMNAMEPLREGASWRQGKRQYIFARPHERAWAWHECCNSSNMRGAMRLKHGTRYPALSVKLAGTRIRGWQFLVYVKRKRTIEWKMWTNPRIFGRLISWVAWIICAKLMHKKLIHDYRSLDATTCHSTSSIRQ